MDHHSSEAEQALLGTVLVNQELCGQIFSIISPSDFAIAAHQRIADRVLDLHKQQKSISAALIAPEFDVDPDLIAIGGKRYIQQLTDLAFATPKMANDLCETIKELSNRRTAAHILKDVSEKIPHLKYDDSISSVITTAIERLSAARSTKINGSITYTTADKTEISLEATDFVQNLLCYGQMSVIYGESNCGKTFFMTDLSIHIASGTPWRGKRVDRGVVVYVSLEGPTGLMKRIVAYKQENPDTDLSKLIIIPSHVNFLDPEGNISEFTQVLSQIKQDHGEIRMVVIDTLARAISGGDENSSQDMGALIKHADGIRGATGAHISFIHHSGKDKLKGARGHSNLRAAIDTEIEITRPPEATHSVARVVKQRDLEGGGEYPFILQRVTLGTNPYGEEITTCIVREITDAPVTAREDQSLTANQQFVYDAIVAAIDSYGQDNIITHKGAKPTRVVAYDDLNKVLDAKGFKTIVVKEDEEYDQDKVNRKVRDATYNARVSLGKRGLIAFNRNHIWLI